MENFEEIEIVELAESEARYSSGTLDSAFSQMR